jgi:hypothetical protein
MLKLYFTKQSVLFYARLNTFPTQVFVELQVSVAQGNDMGRTPPLAIPPDLPEEDNDPINKPAHYTRGKIEMTDFVLDQGLGYLAGQIIKYIVRYRWKGTAAADLKKAKWYLDKLIARVESGHLE